MQQFEGLYRINFSAQGMPPEMYSQVEAFLIATEGRMMALGRHGSRWSGRYTIQGDTIIVDMTFDARDADADSWVLNDQGQPFKGPVTYTGMKFKISQVGTTLMFDGKVTHGAVTYEVVANRLRDLS
jgi:hypothetical protein